MKHISTFIARYMAGLLCNSGQFLAELKEERRKAENYQGDTFERFLQVPEDLPIFQGTRNMVVDPSFFTAEHFLIRHDFADWQHVNSQLMRFSALLIEAARRQKIPLYVHSAFRTKEQQQALFDKGRSQLRWPRAAHCQGAAVDIVHGVHHWQLSKEEWAILGKIGKQIAARMKLPISWGGDWKNFYDPAHWQIKGWSDDIKEYVAGPAVRHTPRAILRRG